MAYVSGGSLSGLYGISSGYGTYGDANVIALLSNYQYPIYVNNSITATGNVSGNIIVGNAFYYGNGVNLVTSCSDSKAAAKFLPTNPFAPVINIFMTLFLSFPHRLNKETYFLMNLI